MTSQERDVRFGHDVNAIQDEAGVDLLQLRAQLALSVEERFLRLEAQLEFLQELQGSANQ